MEFAPGFAGSLQLRASCPLLPRPRFLLHTVGMDKRRCALLLRTRSAVIPECISVLSHKLTRWLKITRVCSLPFLQARSPKSVSLAQYQDVSRVRGFRGSRGRICTLPLPAYGRCGIPWLVCLLFLVCLLLISVKSPSAFILLG